MYYLLPTGHEKLQQKKHGEWWDVQVSSSDYDSLVTLSQVSPLRHDIDGLQIPIQHPTYGGQARNQEAAVQ